MRLQVSVDSEAQWVTDDPYGACFQILHAAGARIAQGETEGHLLDANGNTVGQFEVTL